MVSVNWTTPIPATPDHAFVVVDGIALSATETTVRDFFVFCGTIESLELRKTESGTQSALLKFSSAESAKTALLLSNALINYEAIHVSPLFPDAAPSTPPSGTRDVPQQQQPAAAGSAPDYSGKPALYIVHELLASGYLLGEHVVNRASEFDAKYRVTHRAQEQTRALDSQYKVSDYLTQWDNKFNITKRAQDAYAKIQSHPTGQRAIFTVKDAYNSAIQLHNDARQIAERKRAQGEPLFGKIPIPPPPGAGSSTSAPPPPPYRSAEAAPAQPAAAPAAQEQVSEKAPGQGSDAPAKN